MDTVIRIHCFVLGNPRGRYSATPPLLREPADEVLLEESMGEKGLGTRRDPVNWSGVIPFFF